MLRIDRCANGEVVFKVSGRLSAEHVTELAALLAAEQPGRVLVLDLRDVVLVDREMVQYLRTCARDGVGLRNCPPYIHAWITRASEDS